MKRVLATLGLLAVLLGVPVLLITLGGGPAVPSFEGVRLNDTYMPLDPVLQVLALMAWALWAYLCAAVLLRTGAVVLIRSTGGSPHLLGLTAAVTPKALRIWVDLAIGGAVLAASVGTGSTSADRVAHQRPAIATSQVAPSVDGRPTRERPAYRVRPGDSLWRIAERRLGSGFRWRQIFDLNRGRVFADGERMTNPRLIHPGWILELPVRGEAKDRPLILNGHRAQRDIPERDEPRVTPPAESSSSTASTDGGLHRDHSQPPAVRLPSGLVVAASFASGLLSAELLCRLRRRRRYRPTNHLPAIEPDAGLVRDVRSSGQVQGSSILDPALEALGAFWRKRFGYAPPVVAAIEEARRVAILLDAKDVAVPSEVGGSVGPRIRFRSREGYLEAEASGPFPPHAEDPSDARALVPICTESNTSVVHVAPFGLGVMSLDGGSAPGVIRQMLASAAMRLSPDELQIILLGLADESRTLQALPHVTRSVGWDEATDTITDVQAELLSRARLAMTEGEDGSRPPQPMVADSAPALLIVSAPPPEAWSGIVDAIAVECRRLGAALVAAGWKPSATVLHVDANDTVDIESPILRPHKGYLPLVLAAHDFIEAASVIRDAFPSGEVAGSEESDAGVPRGVGVVEPSTEVSEPGLDLTVSSSEPAPDHPLVPPPAPAEGAMCSEIRCLGPIVVARADGSVPVKGWRAAAKELLAYLVLHPDGVHKERVAETLFPSVPAKKALDLVARAASAVRTRVRTSGDERKYVELDGETWRLEPGVWRVDAWDMERLVDERVTDRDEQIERLRAAIALYRGEFCDDAYFAWAQPARERYRALLIRACALLAERLYESDAAEDALGVLDRAIEAEPLCEDLYRRAMVIEESLSRRRDALDRYTRLKRLLECELDSSPEPETERLARDIERSQRTAVTEHRPEDRERHGHSEAGARHALNTHLV